VVYIKQQIIRELHLLRTDKWLLSMVSWVPVLLFFLLWWIFSAGIPRDLAVGVVDLNHSKLSRSLIRQYDAHPGLNVVRHFPDVLQGVAAMRDTSISSLIVIPYDMEKNVITDKTPQITVFYNSQFLLIGKLTSSAVQQAHATFNAQLGVIKVMSKGKTVQQAFGTAIPVRGQITPLFNMNNNYAHFLSTAAIPAMWQIIIVLITIMALSRELRLEGLNKWLNNKVSTAFIGKILPYTVVMWLHGALFLWFMFKFLLWPMNGNWGILLVSQLLMVLASQAVGLLLFLLVKDPARALSMAAAYTAPCFAFMGVTFPATDMNYVAQIWRSLLPVSHYIEIQIYQANHGASIAISLSQISMLMPFLIVFPVAYLIAHRISRHQSILTGEQA